MGSCPDEEQLVEHVEGRLDPAREAELEAHVDRCASCAGLIAAYAAATFERGDEPARLGPGATVDRYFIVDVLGAGAMGVVYAAYDPQLDRKIALKVIRREALSDDEHQRRLLREAQALARVNHPNVTSVHDAGHDGTHLYLAIELVPGVTLDDWLREPRTVAQIVATFVAAGRGLAAAHAAGLVHRDFKPANVLVDRTGAVKVTDFGLARREARLPDEPHAPEASRRGAIGGAAESGAIGGDVKLATQTRVLVGTPRYMAPEQLAGEPADARSDQFAFCTALYEALHGAPPFAGATIAELVASFEAGPRDDAGAKVPGWLRAVVVRGLARDPAKRFPSLDALLAALLDDPRARRRRWLVGGAAVAAIAAGALVVRAALPGEPEVCEGAGQEVAAAWSPVHAARVRAQFLATGAPYAERVAQSLAATLDRHAEGLAAMHRDSCDATRRRGAQSEIVFDLRVACLERQREDLRALVAELEHADRELVRKSLDLAGALDPVTRCADVDSLRAVDRPPLVIRAQVQAAYNELATAKATLRAGRHDEGGRRLAALEPQARALGYRPLEAEVALARASLADAGADRRMSIEAASRAVFAAMAGRDDQVVFAACRALASQFLSTGEDRGAATPWVQCSRAVAERLAGQADVRANLAYLEAQVADRAGDARAAFALHERALATAEAAYGAADPALVPLLQGLTVQALQVGRAADAATHARRAVAISEAAYGPDHLMTARMRLALGYALAGLDGPEARKVLAGVRALLEREYGSDNHEDLASLDEAMGNAFDTERRLDEALPHYLRSIATRRRLLGPTAPAVAAALYNLGATLNGYGRHRDALPYLDEALPIYAAANSERHITVGVCHFERGRALHHLGKPADALAALERAQPILVAQTDDAQALGDLHQLLAHELWTATRRAEARAAMESARAAFTRGELDDGRKASEAWLAAHP